MRLGKLVSVGEVVEDAPVEEPTAPAQPEPLETATDQERAQVPVVRTNR